VVEDYEDYEAAVYLSVYVCMVMVGCLKLVDLLVFAWFQSSD